MVGAARRATSAKLPDTFTAQVSRPAQLGQVAARATARASSPSPLAGGVPRTSTSWPETDRSAQFMPFASSCARVSRSTLDSMSAGANDQNANAAKPSRPSSGSRPRHTKGQTGASRRTSQRRVVRVTTAVPADEWGSRVKGCSSWAASRRSGNRRETHGRAGRSASGSGVSGYDARGASPALGKFSPRVRRMAACRAPHPERESRSFSRFGEVFKQQTPCARRRRALQIGCAGEPSPH